MPDSVLTFAKRWHRRLPLHFNSRCLGLLEGATPSANPFSRPSGYPYTTSAYLLIFSHPHDIVISLATSPKHHFVVPFSRTSHVDASHSIPFLPLPLTPSIYGRPFFPPITQPDPPSLVIQFPSLSLRHLLTDSTMEVSPN